MSNYPPGVTGAEPQITGEDPEAEDFRRCRSCGEPEMVGQDGAEFGWFDDSNWETVCQRCGTVQS